MFVVLVNCVVSLTHWEELPILPGIWVDVLSANGTEQFGWMSFQPMGQRHLGGCPFSQWDGDICDWKRPCDVPRELNAVSHACGRDSDLASVLFSAQTVNSVWHRKSRHPLDSFCTCTCTNNLCVVFIIIYIVLLFVSSLWFTSPIEFLFPSLCVCQSHMFYKDHYNYFNVTSFLLTVSSSVILCYYCVWFVLLCDICCPLLLCLFVFLVFVYFGLFVFPFVCSFWFDLCSSSTELCTLIFLGSKKSQSPSRRSK